MLEGYLTSGSEGNTDDDVENDVDLQGKVLQTQPNPHHEYTKSANMKQLDLTKIKLNMIQKNQDYIPPKPKAQTQNETLISNLKKQISKWENKCTKYKRYYKEVKEIALNFKFRYEEVNAKLNEFMNIKIALQGNGGTTKDLTGERNLNTSIVIIIFYPENNSRIELSGENNLDEHLDEADLENYDNLDENLDDINLDDINNNNQDVINTKDSNTKKMSLNLRSIC